MNRARCSRCKIKVPLRILVPFKGLDHYCPSCFSKVVELFLKDSGAISK